MTARPASEPVAVPAAGTGLRQVLRQEGQAGIPIESQPFVSLARQVGGGLREVLASCRQLAGDDPAHGIQVHWSPALGRVRWRVSTVAPPAQHAAAAEAIARLPGVARWTARESLPGAPDEALEPAAPTIWFDLVARDVAAASAQLRQLRRQVPTLSWWAHRPGPAGSTAAAPCRCDAGCGPCADPDLAVLCERGLPVVARPYQAAASALGRSERDVVLRLRGWHRARQLLSLTMSAADDTGDGLQIVATWPRLTLRPGDAEALAAAPGVSAVEQEWLPGWPVGVIAAPGGHAALRRALQGCGLPVAQAHGWIVRTHRLRSEPLLFG